MYARNIDTTISRAKNRRRRWNFALILRHLLENSLEIKFQIPLVTGLKLLAKTFIKETSSFFHCNFNYTGYSAQLRPKFWQEKHRGSQIFEMEKKNLYIEENAPRQFTVSSDFPPFSNMQRVFLSKLTSLNHRNTRGRMGLSSTDKLRLLLRLCSNGISFPPAYAYVFKWSLGLRDKQR